MTDTRPADEELLQGMQNGDEEAFLTLYRRWQAPIFRFAWRMSGSRQAAEDATQEVFMALVRNSSGYCAANGSFRSWLYGVARHVTRRAMEREKQPSPTGFNVDGETEIENLRSSRSDPHEETVRRQQTERLRAIVLSLPLHYREVVVLCELQELDYAEAAESLGCSIGTVRSRLHRARSILAERLQSAKIDAAKQVRKIAPDGCAV